MAEHIPTSFQRLGISDQFARHHQVSHLSHSDLIPLPGINLPQPVSAFVLLDSQFATEVHSLMLVKEEKTEQDLLGYVTFSRGIMAPKSWPVAELNTALNRRMLFDIRDQVPGFVLDTLTSTPCSYAIKVSQRMQGQNFGGLLWALGCGLMEDQGVKVIRIWNDGTVNNKTKRGFYDRYGVMDFSKKNPKAEFLNKYALSHLSAEQEIIVARAFGKDLLN